MSKRHVLFVYSRMIVGGSTTSLLALLARLDYGLLDVDLLLLDPVGPLNEAVPKQVKVMGPDDLARHWWHRALWRRFVSPRYVFVWLLSVALSRWRGNPLIRSQIMGQEIGRFYPQPLPEYDVAVSFLEFAPAAYVAERVRAQKKIAWLHADYGDAGLLPRVESKTLGTFDHIVLVSKANLKSFTSIYPEFSPRACVVENIIDPGEIRRKAAASSLPLSSNHPDPREFGLNLVSNSRIDFVSKGHDRVVRALARAERRTVLSQVHWWVIGDGPDMEALRALISQEGLDEVVSLMGELQNPFPLMRLMDVFFLPSRYEGKPMAVTEARALGLPVLITQFASAEELVADSRDGLIVANSEDGILGGIRRLVSERGLIEELRSRVGDVGTDYQLAVRNVERLLGVE